ncbi:MAG: hypothetical protein U0704_09760 [Candidatus Eisenbacteria bacterium]
MNAVHAVLELQDLDDLLVLANDRDACAKLKRLGFTLSGGEHVRAAREAMAPRLERRWLLAYERSLTRWGRGVTMVRAKVCQGCFMTLPTSAAPPPGDSVLHVCESCGRLLWWR